MPEATPITPIPRPIDRRKALSDAAAAYSEKSGINAEAIAVMTTKFVGLLASRWEQIADTAMSEDHDGKITVSFGFSIDLSRRCPSGKAAISFSAKTRDDVDWRVDDPAQMRMAIADEVSTPPAQSAAPSPRTAIVPSDTADDELNATRNQPARTPRRRREPAQPIPATAIASTN